MACMAQRVTLGLISLKASHVRFGRLLYAGVASRSSSPRCSYSTTPFEGETEYSNLSPKIRSLTEERLLHRPGHPLHTLKRRIHDFFQAGSATTLLPGTSSSFALQDSLPPIVSTKQNFEELLTAPDHPSRAKDESYYLSEDSLLRCHMTAHQRNLLEAGHSSVLFAGDVYRRDTIDATHYPVFHQMDGFRVFTDEQLALEAERTGKSEVQLLQEDLQYALEQLARHIFGARCHTRWVDATFPFTHPSWELEVHFDPSDVQAGEKTYEGKVTEVPGDDDENWLEVLGSGIIHEDILGSVRPNSKGWAFGLGLERWAMVLYGIPDIRLFWSKDQRFVSQFKEGEITKFKPFSKYPACYKDISFWVSPAFTSNDFYELVRGVAGDLVENVTLQDTFVHPKTQKESHSYRLNFRSMERSLTNEEVNRLQMRIREEAVTGLGVELR